MKKYLLYINLLAILGAVWTFPSLAEKKYRYIKREHGVKFQGNVPIAVSPFSLSANFQGAYAYNWKGFVEVGPYFQVGLTANQGFSLTGWAAGLMGEYNFIKKSREKKIDSFPWASTGYFRFNGSSSSNRGCSWFSQVVCCKKDSLYYKLTI